MRFCKVRLDSTGQEMFLIGDTLEDDGGLVEDVQDYVDGERAFAAWIPGIGVLKRGEIISREITRLSDWSTLPAMTDEGAGKLIARVLGGGTAVARN